MEVVSRCMCFKCRKLFYGITSSGNPPPNICPECVAEKEQEKMDARQVEINIQLAELATLSVEVRLAKLDEALIELADQLDQMASRSINSRSLRF